MMRGYLLLAGMLLTVAGGNASAQTVTASISTPVTPLSAADLTAGSAVTVYTGITVNLTGCNNDSNAGTTKCSVWLSASPDVGSSGPISGVALRWGTTQAGCTIDVRSGQTPNSADTPVLEVAEPATGTRSGSATIWLCMTTNALSWASAPTVLTPTLYFGRGRN